MKYSVIVLCYKADKSIISELKKIQLLLEEEKVKYELILVCNYLKGDQDQNYNIIKNFVKENDNSNIFMIHKQKKGMYGWDVKLGLEKSTGDYIAFIDGDGQFDMNDLIRVYKECLIHGYDFVKTYRYIRKDGILRYFQSKIYNNMFMFFFPYYKTKDINSKPKIFTRDTLNKLVLKNNGWFIDTEIFLKVNFFNLKYKEIPTEFNELQNRKSLVNYKAVFELFFYLVFYRIKYFLKK